MRMLAAHVHLPAATSTVFSSTNSLYTEVAIQNVDTSTGLWCSDDSAVNSTVGNEHCGWKIVAGQAADFRIISGNKFYCVNDGATGATYAVIRRSR